MAEPKPLYSTCVAVLGFICFIVGATAVFIPVWGYFDTGNGKLRSRGWQEPTIADFLMVCRDVVRVTMPTGRYSDL